MTKQKKSFMEKLIGSSKKEAPENDIEMENETRTNVLSEDEPGGINIPQTNLNNGLNELSDNTDDEWSAPTNDDAGIVSDDENGEGQLTVDVYQTDDDIIIKSTIAGVNPEDLDVSINNDMITIKGERKFEDEVSEENFYYQECYWGSFSRSIVLPVDVVAEKIEATLKNGILTIKLPKADTNRTKKIKVRGF